VVERKDVEAAVEARRELGKDYEPEIVDSLVEKIERRLDERLQERSPPAPRHRPYDIRLPIASMGIGIGATAVATGNNHSAGGVVIAIIAWIAIALVNIAYSQRR
jgi:hypothetical protein